MLSPHKGDGGSPRTDFPICEAQTRLLVFELARNVTMGDSLRDFGMLTMAFGPQKYIDQAITLSRSLRRNMPGYRIAVVSDRADLADHFDIVVPMRTFETAGTVHKVDMADYSPFAETLFIDSDCVVLRNFEPELREIRRFQFTPIVAVFLRRGDRDLWLDDVGAALDKVGGKAFPKFNGGVYFWRDGETGRQVFDESKAVLAQARELGIRDFDAAGPGEETLIGIALAKLGITEFYNDNGRLMRTPLNSTGPITAEVMTGESGFIKEGILVRPAILHFCGPWIKHPAYVIASRELARSRRLGHFSRGIIHVRWKLGNAASKVRRRLSR